MLCVADMSGEQMSKEIKAFCNEIGSTLRALEECTPWANKAELYFGLLKEAVMKDMKDQDSPMVFRDYCTERRARIHNLAAKSNFKLHGSDPYTLTLGEEENISNLCQLGWYEWCYYREDTAAFPNQQEGLGRVLGPARGEGNKMCQWVLKGNGKVVPRRSNRPLNPSVIHSEVEHLRSYMHHIGFKSCPADPDVWMRSAITSDGTELYEYVLLYTDDALTIGVEAESILRKEIGKYLELKDKSIGPPKLYLGGHLSLVELDNGVKAWAFSSSQYVRAAVQNEEDLHCQGRSQEMEASE
jgi:hypothetical protein